MTTDPNDSDNLSKYFLLALQNFARNTTQRGEGSGQTREASQLLQIQSQLQTLARDYTKRKKRQEQTALRIARFDAVALAAKNVQTALNTLSYDELLELSQLQQQCFSDYLKTIDEETCFDLGIDYETVNCTFSPNLADQMAKYEDLTWLIQAAELTKKSRKRGGQTNEAERWAACEFVLICDRFGWSPIKIANGGTEKKGGVELSAAVLCLAAVYANAGIPVERCLANASSALRSLRKPYWHQRCEAAYREDDFENVDYQISLKKVRRQCDIFVGNVPNFLPKGIT